MGYSSSSDEEESDALDWLYVFSADLSSLEDGHYIGIQDTNMLGTGNRE